MVSNNNEKFVIDEVFYNELNVLQEEIKLLSDISDKLDSNQYSVIIEKLDKLSEINFSLNIENHILKEKINFLKNKNKFLEKELESNKISNSKNKFNLFKKF